MESSTLVDLETIDASASVVCVVAHGPMEHGTMEVEEDGKKVRRCSLYPNLDCAEHDANSPFVGNYIQGRYRIPASFWLDGDGKELFRKLGYRRPLELQRDMRDALAKLPGPRLPAAEYRAIRKALDAGRAALDAGRWGEAMARFRSVPKGAPAILRGQADAALAELRGNAERMLGEADVLRKGKDLDGAKALLKTVATDFAGTPEGDSAAARLKELE